MSGQLKLNAVDMDKVVDEPINWLWPGVFATGCISIICGNPGLGKSTVVASICSIVSNGGTWPVTGEASGVGRAIYVTTEDDVAQDFRPRLYAAGAAMERVTFISDLTVEGEKQRRTIDLQQHIPLFRDCIEQRPDTRVIILDPLNAFLPNADTNNDAKTRNALLPLSDLARECRIAILCVMHHNKNQRERGALMAVGGSIAFTGLARSVVGVYKDFKDDGRRIFKCVKNNKARDNYGVAFRIEPFSYDQISTSRVSWETDLIDTDADDLVLGERDCAIGFLKDELASGPVTWKDLIERASAEEYSAATLRRARDQLKSQGLIRRRSEGKSVFWFLSDRPFAQNAHFAHPLNGRYPSEGGEQAEQTEQINT